MDIILLGFLSMIFISMGYKMLKTYKSYEHTFYSYLFSNYLEYYFKLKVRKNLSVSSWCNHEIGEHRIVYHNYLNEEGKAIYQFITIFHLKGIQVFSIISSKGEFTGKIKDKYWIIHRDDKTYRIQNPENILTQHLEHLKSSLQVDIPINTAFLFPTDSNVEKLKTNYPCVNYDQFTSILKESNNSLSSEQIKNLFKNYSKIKNNEALSN